MQLELGVALPHDVTADASLEVGYDRGETVVAHLLELTEDAGLEEDLRVTDTVRVAYVQSGEDLIGGDLAVDEAGSDGVRSEDRVSEDESGHVRH